MGTERGFKESPPVQIVELLPDAWRLLRDLKLGSLQEEPIAFEDPDEGREKYTTRTESEWRDVLSGKMTKGRRGESVQVFAKDGENAVGMVSAIIPESPERVATIQHMYVRSEYRGRHIGRELFEGLLNRLKQRGDLKKIELQVITSQAPAVEMYKSFGFKEVGRKNVLRGGQEYEEFEMELGLPENARERRT